MTPLIADATTAGSILLARCWLQYPMACAAFLQPSVRVRATGCRVVQRLVAPAGLGHIVPVPTFDGRRLSNAKPLHSPQATQG